MLIRTKVARGTAMTLTAEVHIRDGVTPERVIVQCGGSSLGALRKSLAGYVAYYERECGYVARGTIQGICARCWGTGEQRATGKAGQLGALVPCKAHAETVGVRS